MPTVEIFPTGYDDAKEINDRFRQLGTCTVKLGPGNFRFLSPVEINGVGAVLEGYGEASAIAVEHDGPAILVRAHGVKLCDFTMESKSKHGSVGILYDTPVRASVVDGVRI